MNQAKLDFVATQLMQCFESGLSIEKERLLQQQQLEIQQMKAEMEQLHLQSELSMCSVESASTSSIAEIKNTITIIAQFLN